MATTTSKRRRDQPVGLVAGGLIDRRTVLRRALALPFLAPLTHAASAESVNAERPAWMRAPGVPMSAYGRPSAYEADVVRAVAQEYRGIAPEAGVSLTPLHRLRGSITPAGLHFERHHSGVPQIDPGRHHLMIHGEVERPLVFGVDALLRYPVETRIGFVECAGNSFPNAADRAPAKTCGAIHGLLSNSEWGGVSLRRLLDEAGLRKTARWLIAEGADAAAMVRSIPLSMALDDGMVALYQNGERLRPEQGYPARLWFPGLEGNLHIKWVRRIKVSERPAHSRDETSKYSDRLADGSALQFTLEMGVKSIITMPSGQMQLPRPGWYEIEGLAWSGSGRVRAVDVSADGGHSWVAAHLDDPALDRALTRFRIPWEWRGEPQVIESRAVDESGAVQPTREHWKRRYAAGQIYHNNAIQRWRVDAQGRVENHFG